MRFLVRVSAATVVRRLTLLALVALLGWLGMGNARAGNDGDAGMAFRHCHQSGAAKVAQYNETFVAESYTCVLNANSTATSGSYQCGAKIVRKSDGYVQYSAGTCSLATFSYSSGTGSTDKHNYTSSCSTRADLGGLYVSNFQNGPKLCNFGCEFDQAQKQSDTTITDNNNPSNTLRFGVLLGGKANGNVCNNDTDEPKKAGEEDPPCLVVGQDSAGPIKHCPQEDGRSCTVSGRGTKFCQPPAPNTEGPKVDTGRQDGNSQSTGPNTQPQPPAPRPGESFAPSSSSTVTDNISNTSSQSNTFVQTGTPNVNGTPVPGDGSGPGGTGQQAGSGSGGTPVGGTNGTDMGPTNSLLDGIKGTVGSIKDFLTGWGDEAGTLDDSQGEDQSAVDAWQDETTDLNIDASGYGWGTTCPTPPSIDVPGGGSLDWSLLCQLAAAFGMLILAAGYVQAAFVIGGA